MKLNEFLTEIQIQPEAAEKIGTIVSSDRVTQKNIWKTGFCITGTELRFIRKYFRRRITGCCFLYYFGRMGAEAYEAYEKRGLGRDIFGIHFMI